MALSCVYFCKECDGCMRCYDDGYVDDDFLEDGILTLEGGY